MPSARPLEREVLLPMIQAFQVEIDNWYAASQAELNLFQRKVTERIDRARRSCLSGSPAPAADPPSTPPPKRHAAAGEDLSNEAADWAMMGGLPRDSGTPPAPPAFHRDVMSAMMTPMGSPQSSDRVPLEQLLARISAVANAPPLNFDNLYEQLAGDSPQQNVQQAGVPSASSRESGHSIPLDSIMHMQGQAKTASLRLHRPSENARPAVLGIDGALPSDDDPARYHIDPNSPCQALVEFKRKRVLQYDSRHYVAPGEYVLVGGDRGEDLGLVIYTWCETNDGKVQGIGLTGSSLSRSIGVGSGKVLRVATPFEVSQLHGIQTELERRAIDVCQQRVIDHALPMVIVDAEYQFDNKKLTFYYEAQQRLDFRELVRDLFKTFRARIWMELATKD